MDTLRTKAQRLAHQLSLFDQRPETPRLPRPGPAAEAVGDEDFAALCRGGFSHVQVQAGKRLRDSWRVRWLRRTEALQLEIPARLLAAPREVKQALLQWAVLVSKRGLRRDPERRALRGRLESIVRAFLADRDAADAPAEKRRLARNRARLERLNPRGVCHDLEAALARVNREYFNDELHARITWSARWGGLSTHSVAHDGEGLPYHLISISRGYDNPEVTPEILGGVVYHECLHIAIPPRDQDGRRVMHGSDFRKRERQYAHYAVWRKWHREGLPKALRKYRPR